MSGESHQALLIRLMKGQRATDDPEVIMAAAAKGVGQHLGADRAGFFQMADDDRLEFGASWTGGRHERLVGRWPAANIGARCLSQMRAGRAFGVSDTTLDPATSGSRFDETGARAIIAAPICRGGRLLAGLYVNQAIVRNWTAGELAVVQTIADITWEAVDRARAITAIRESEKCFREIADVAPVLIWMSDCTKACTWFNKPWLDFTGRTMGQELGHGWLEGVHPDDVDGCLATYNEAFDRREPFRMDYRLKRHDGVWRIVNDIGVQRYSSEGTFLGYIGSCLDVNDQRAAEQSLRESESRLRRASEAAGFGVFDCEPGKRRLVGSAQLSRLLGAGDRDIDLPFESALRAVRPEDRPWAAAKMNEIVRRPGPYELEVRFVRPDGTGGWLLGRGELIGPVDKETGFVSKVTGTVIDITERKIREQSIGLLLKEVNHRSKNMLALVLAIARQTGARGGEDFLERFTERLLALSASQDVLVKSEWKGAEMIEVVQSQLAPFQDLIGSRIHMQGEDLHLSAAATQSVAMALHELVTNAGKYGSLSNSSGQVDIAWRLTADRFFLSWQESKGPAVAVPAQRGFGSFVIESMLNMSLRADVQLDFAPSGVTWRIACPAEEVLGQIS